MVSLRSTEFYYKTRHVDVIQILVDVYYDKSSISTSVVASFRMIIIQMLRFPGFLFPIYSK